MPSFLVNYGGPVRGYSSNESQFQEIFAACEKKYHAQAKSTSFHANGLDLTYYQVGIHRMIRIDLPEAITLDLDSSNSQIAAQARKTQQLFQTVTSRASDFNTHDYHLLSHNCVTAVSNVLNIIDPDLLSGVMKVVPASLDSNVKKVVQKDALLESMLEECIRGTIAIEEPDEEIDELYNPLTAARVWREAMTSVDEIKEDKEVNEQQSNMKTQMQSLRDSAANTSETHQQPPTPH